MTELFATEVLPTHTPALFEAAVLRAAQLLRAGDVVALPTETVYGLAANAFDAGAVSRIYEIKGRPAHNPIIVHIVGLEMARRCAAQWPPLAARLAAAFWPGPLTLVLPRASVIPDIVTAGGPTVGLRWPAHPLIQAVIRECGFPLAAPSANPANSVSPTNAGHVRKQLGDKLRLVVDGGQSQVGIESTVLDVAASPPRVLRPGMIHNHALVAVVGTLGHGALGSGALRSPGLLPRHYAPQAKVFVWQWSDDHDLRRRVRSAGLDLSKCHVIAHTRIPSLEPFGRVSVIPRDPEAFARAMYAEWHQCDAAGAETIIVESPPDTTEWLAIRDRLQRAASD